MTQAELANEAGIGRATLQRLERGQSVQSVSLVKVFRTLGLLSALDGALPESIELPIVALERQQHRVRKRARRSRRGTPIAPDTGAWRWGEEPEGNA